MQLSVNWWHIDGCPHLDGTYSDRLPVRWQKQESHPSSKRIWSLPLPVAPCDTASAPVSRAISICRLAMRGLAIDVPSR